MKRVLLFAAASLALASLAGTAAAADTHEMYVGVGTTGATIGYGQAFGPRTALRVEGDFLSYSHDFNTSSANYKGKLKIAAAGIYYDAFVAGPFRLTGGVLIGKREFNGHADGIGGTVTINHQQYSAAGQFIDARAKYSTVSPYVGLGWGHRPERGGLGFFGDVGVAYGHPSVSLNLSPELAQAAGAENVAAEKASLESKADNLKVYPVVRVGIDYQW